MTISRSNEKLPTNLSGSIDTKKQETPIDYKNELEKLGIPEESIDSKLVHRFREHLTLYSSGAEANLALLQERISSGNLSSVEEKVKELDKWLKEHENKKQEPTTSITKKADEVAESVNKVAESAIDSVGGSAAKAASTQVDGFVKSLIAKIPYIGEALGEKFSSENWIKGIFASIFSGLGIAKFFKIGKTEKEEASSQTSSSDKSIEKKDPPKNTDVSKDKEKKDPNIEEDKSTTRNTFYKVGAKFLIGLSGVSLDRTRTKEKEDVLSILQDMKLSDISALHNNPQRLSLLPEGKNTAQHVNMLSRIIGSLETENTKKLLEIGLSPKSMKNTLKPNGKTNTKLAENLGNKNKKGSERLEEIYTMSQSGNFDYRELSLQELSIIYISSIPALRIGAIAGLQNLGKDIVDGMHEDIGDEASGFTESLLPKNVIQAFGEENKNFSLGGSSLIEYDENVRKDIGDKLENPEEKQALEELITFKNTIVSDTFLSEKKLHLTKTQKEIFLENINYGGIIALYEILGGETDLQAMNPITLPALLLTISHIIGAKGKNQNRNILESTSYIGGYMKDFVFQKDTSLGISDDERMVLEIYGEKTADTIIMSYMRQFYSMLGYPEGITGVDLGYLAAGTFIGGAGANAVGNRLIKRGLDKGRISILGKFTKKLGILGILSSIALGGAKALGTGFKSGMFESSLEDAVKEDNVHKVIETLKKHQESMETYTINGKPAILVAFPGDTPYISYNGKVWAFDVIDTSNNPEVSFKYAYNTLLSLISESGEAIVGPNGEEVSLEEASYENGNLVLGQGNNKLSFDIKSILESSPNIAEETQENLPKQFEKMLNSNSKPGDIVRKVPFSGVFETLEGKTLDYMPLKNIGQDSQLALVSIGSIKNDSAS